MEKVTDKSAARVTFGELYRSGDLPREQADAYRAGLEEAARAMCRLCAERIGKVVNKHDYNGWQHEIEGIHSIKLCNAGPIWAIRAIAQAEPPSAYEMSRISPQLCEVHGVVHKCELMAVPAAAKIGETQQTVYDQLCGMFPKKDVDSAIEEAKQPVKGREESGE